MYTYHQLVYDASFPDAEWRESEVGMEGGQGGGRKGGREGGREGSG